uniref:Uncharacterized protein n=1 Tax=Anguilla anguilla TaxID=7936 RepID=A0A0E9PBH4_ANGAN
MESFRIRNVNPYRKEERTFLVLI